MECYNAKRLHGNSLLVLKINLHFKTHFVYNLIIYTLHNIYIHTGGGDIIYIALKFIMNQHETSLILCSLHHLIYNSLK